jgi:methyl-accepting chemotaxis protein WspA
MKRPFIRQRLNTSVVLFILLLLAGVALGIWVQMTRSAVEHRKDLLEGAGERIHRDLDELSESLRGQLLEPRSEAEKSRQQTAEAELKKNVDELKEKFRGYPELVSAGESLYDFVAGPRNFQSRVTSLAESDPVGATAYYKQNYAPVNEQRDKLLGELTRQMNKINDSERDHAQTYFIVGVTCIVIILLATLLVGQKQSAAVTEPLSRLVAALDRMRQGDFTQRIALDRKDEFGVLAKGLDQLAEDLSALVGQVQRSGIQVNTTTLEISATAREQQGTAHEIAATTAEIGATSKEISATSKELVKTMNEVNEVAEETADLAGSGQAALARMETTMRQIIEASSSITAKLSVLSEKTTNINSVVTTITKVADQTNLLSLNAAIEAEKAGEYGLGFAVVAMEIRRLADQTAVATYDIEKMVKEMQTAVAAGVMGMDKFSEEVRRGVEEMRQVSTHLAQIIHQVQTLTPRFQTVNEGMHAQATGAQQISETLSQLGEAAQQTADSLRQSNLAIEQLNGAARGLQTSVARFKLGL